VTTALSGQRPAGERLANRVVLCYKYNMTSVGVRELRQRASELLRLVEQGEVVEITDRGRPVARLTPLPTGTPLEQMRASGEIEPASGDIEDLPEPLVLPDGVEAPSAALARLRRQER
jgi:prevent-host-death family protein